MSKVHFLFHLYNTPTRLCLDIHELGSIAGVLLIDPKSSPLFYQMTPSTGLSLQPEVPSTGLAARGRQGKPQERPRVASCCVCYLSLPLSASRPAPGQPQPLPRSHAVLLQSGLSFNAASLGSDHPAAPELETTRASGRCSCLLVTAGESRLRQHSTLVRRRAPPECHRLPSRLPRTSPATTAADKVN